MDLPNLFSATDEGAGTLIICIVLSDSSVQSLLLNISLKGTKIIQKSKIIPYTDQASCVVKTDESLQELGKESEKINEVLFGLEHAWLEGSAIADSKKSLLHTLTTELSLKPLGFVVQTEALYQHYISHNAHASIILLVFSEQFLSVVIVVQGKPKLTETVGRSQDIMADITEALARYVKKHEGTYLPARFVCASLVLPETELNQYQQQLLDVTWGEEFPFAQKPTVDAMRSELAISLIAQQAGQAIAASLTQGAAQTEISSMSKKVETASAQDMGFSNIEKEQLKTETAIDDSVQSNVTSFGVPIKTEMITATQEPTVHQIDEGEEEVLEKPSMWKKLLGQQTLSLGTKRQVNVRTLIIGGVTAGVVALIVVAAIFIFFFSQVTAVIVPKEVTVSKEVRLTIDPEAQASDPQNLIIPGEAVSKSITQETTIQTTGVKIVGDKAKGEVLLYNKTTADKKFPVGTVVAIDTLQFITDQEVTVPAATVEERQGGSQTDYGEAKVPVTAYLIGVEGNIAKEKELSVADFDKSTYSAQSTVDFTGGSSREVRVVAQEDLDAVLAEAKKTALETATTEFAAQSQNGIYILPTNTLEVASVKYSAELEKEADELTATVEAKIVALSYKTEDLKPLAVQILSSEVPQGYEITTADPQILSAPAENVDNQTQVALMANISTTALPVFNEASMKQDIAGKPVEEATSVMKSKTGVESVSFVFYPSWAQAVISHLPTQLERITIKELDQ